MGLGVLAVDLCALAHTEFLNEIVLCLVWRNTGGALAATLGRCAMSRELWVVTRECNDGDFWVDHAHRYRDEALDHLAFSGSYPNKVTRYVPADSLQPEWWCENGVMYMRVLDNVESWDLIDTSEVALEDQIGVLANAMATKLWCGGL